jgi:c(7)-type cytochrome triheme protein
MEPISKGFLELKQQKGENTMKMITTAVALLIAVMFVGSAFAVPAGKSVEWEKGGKVTFDGKVHADKGLKCNDCHTKIFQMKKGSTTMKMDDIKAGKFCGACHDGTKAFKASDAANCGKCHKK